MKNALMIVATVAGMAATTTAPAWAHGHGQRTDAECRQNQRTAGVVGGLLGAGAGGAAGNAIAATNLTTEGVIIGVLVGAVAGSHIGRNAVYCPPAESYVQPGGRSYGEAPGHFQPAPGYAAPAHAAPAWQPPGYQPPAYAPPVYHAQPVYAPPAPVYSHPGWYAPSTASYYSQERSSQMVPVAPPAPRPAFVPQAGFAPAHPVVTQSYGHSQSWSSGQSQSWSYGPTYVPAPGGAAMPCTVTVCR